MYLSLALFALALSTAYLYLTRKYNYWKDQNVPCAPNPLPGIGHTLRMILVRDSIGMWADKLYKQMGNRSMYGCYFMQTPALVIRDPQLIKVVLNTNFAGFRNNMTSINDELDNVMVKNAFFAKDDVWKESRQMLVNNFSGKTLRCVFETVSRVCDRCVEFIARKVDAEAGFAELETRDLMSRITGEVVANTVFGIEGHSFEDESDYHAFTNFAKRLFETTTLNGLERIIRTSSTRLATLLGLRLIPKETDLYFRNILRTVIKSRIDSNETKGDFLQFIIEKMDEIDEEMAVAQATSLFFDGYETLGSVTSSVVYHLADNPEVQKKAREEVNAVVKEFDSKLTYESTKRMNYLEQVMYETLRLNPGLTEFLKVCTESTTLRGYDGLSCQLEPGHIVVISAVGLSNDEEYWPNPSVFDPERFSSVASERHKYVYLPFGEGPRKCVGIRYAVMTLKTILAMILQNYSLETSPRTKLPLKMNPNSFSFVADGGMWVRFKPLNS